MPFQRLWLLAIAASLFALAAILALQTAPAQPPGKGAAPPPPKVLVTPAVSALVTEQRSFVGTVWPVRRSLVGSAAPGRVEEYLVNEGDAVKKGQPIAHLRRGIIQAELNAAKAMLAVRQAELAELETSYDDEVKQADAKHASALAGLTYRKAKLQRSSSLGGSIARELLEEDSSLAQQAEATLREAEAALRVLTGGARQQKTEQARASVEAQAAEVERLTEQFERHTMFAPFDGYVTAEHTEVGQWVMQGDPVAEIVELKQVEVGVAVMEDYIAGLTQATAATVEVPALGSQSFQGQVSVVNPLADTRARTFPVKIRIDNDLSSGQPLLKGGMLARVTLPIGKSQPYVLVPKDAVVLGGPSPVVFVAATAGGKTTVRPVPVKLGTAQGTWIVALEGIQAGDSVVVEGNERVRPGQEVRPEKKEIAAP